MTSELISNTVWVLGRLKEEGQPAKMMVREMRVMGEDRDNYLVMPLISLPTDKPFSIPKGATSPTREKLVQEAILSKKRQLASLSVEIECILELVTKDSVFILPGGERAMWEQRQKEIEDEKNKVISLEDRRSNKG